MKLTVNEQIERYKAQCPPWVLDLWDADDDRYLAKKFRPIVDDD